MSHLRAAAMSDLPTPNGNVENRALAEALQGFQESERQQLFSLLNRVRDNLVAATSEALPASSAGRRTRKAA